MKKRKKMKPVTAWACVDSDGGLWWRSISDHRPRARAWLSDIAGQRIVRVRITEAPKRRKRRSKKP